MTSRDPQVTAPAGTTSTDKWEGTAPNRHREIDGSSYGVDGHDVIVWTAAIQHEDGKVSAPAVHVKYASGGLTSAQARELAEQLLAAADEADSWVATDGAAETWTDSVLKTISRAHHALMAAEITIHRQGLR